MGFHGLSPSLRQIVQVVLALAGPSKRPFVNPTLAFLGSVLLSFWVPRVHMIWGHAQEIITLVLVEC